MPRLRNDKDIHIVLKQVYDKIFYGAGQLGPKGLRQTYAGYKHQVCNDHIV